MQKILTLLTDFGYQDSYVGIMKGVMYQLAWQSGAAGLTIVDLTHAIPPQDIAAARFNLLQAWAYFPAGTVHVVIVDPGVGGKRRAIAVEFGGGFLVGPDNGVLGGVLEQSPALAAVELTNPHYWRTPYPSHTFHGRDIFAAAAAYLVSGVPMDQLGQRIEVRSLTDLILPSCQANGSTLQGVIQYVDHFGNLVTNIPGIKVIDQQWSVILQGHLIPSRLTYTDSQPGALVCLIGSHQWVEIAVNGGSAQAQLRVTVGTQVLCQIHPAIPSD
jgi:S-adenosyl-L-methionine hydrolase (adenosine-forming)